MLTTLGRPFDDDGGILPLSDDGTLSDDTLTMTL